MESFPEGSGREVIPSSKVISEGEAQAAWDSASKRPLFRKEMECSSASVPASSLQNPLGLHFPGLHTRHNKEPEGQES